MSNPLRRNPSIAGWLDELKASRDARELRKKYEPLIAKATAEKDWNERDRLNFEWSIGHDEVYDPIYARRGDKLIEKAKKYGIAVPRRPYSHTEDSDYWVMSRMYGYWLPNNKLFELVRPQFRDERRARYEEFRKWATLGFAVLGFLLGFESLRIRQKQPDPCQRNYYRDDSGACVFALEKPAQQAQVQAPPPASAQVVTAKPARKHRTKHR